MRVLLICHYFPPEVGAPQARLSELAGAWAASGDEVTVLTGMPNHPTGSVPPRYRGRLRFIESMDGYRVVRTWLYATPNRAVVRKTLGHLSFMVSSVVLGGRASGPADVVVVSSPTFFSVFAAWFLARVKRAALVVEVRDLWPAIFVELGVLRNRLLVKLLERLELTAYRAADAVVVVTEGFRRNLVGRGVPRPKVHVIPNGADVERFGSHETKRDWRADLGADGTKTLVLYVGAHGISHGLAAVAEAATRLRTDDVHFAFVGDGAAKPDLERVVSEQALTNVTLHPAVARDAVPDILAAADICLAPLRDVPLFASFIPSKIFEYLAAGRPVIGSLRGEPAEILRRAGAVVVAPEDPQALAEAIREVAADAMRRERMGREGRAFVGAHYDRRVLAARYRGILAAVTRG